MRIAVLISLLTCIGARLHGAPCQASYSLPSGATKPHGAVFSPDGTFLATANNGDNNVTLFNVSQGVLSGGTNYALPGSSSLPYSVAFSPNGAYLATSNASNDVTLFAVTGTGLSGGASAPLPTGANSPTTVAFSPDSSHIVTANYATNNVTVFAINNGVLSTGINYALPAGSQEPWTAAFSLNGLYLATANGNAGTTSANGVTIFQVNAGVLSSPVSYNLPTNNGGAFAATFSPDNVYLAVVDASRNVIIYSVGTGGVLNGGTAYPLPSGVSTGYEVAFSPDGSYLATANNGPIGGANTLTLFNFSAGVPSNALLLTLASSLPYSVAFSPDSLYLATADSGSNNVTVFPLQSSCSTSTSSGSPISLIYRSIIGRILSLRSLSNVS